MRYLSSISLALVVLMALAACSSTDIEATVEARLGQERAIEATVEARVKEEKASLPTPAPTPTPTPTATDTPIPTATNTPIPTATPTPKPKPTATRVRPTRTPRPTQGPTWTPRPPPTPRPTSTPVVIDDYGDNRSTAASVYLTVANSPLKFTGEIGTRGDIDSFSFQSWSGDSFVFQANYLSRGSIVTAVGHPKLVLYRISPSTPLEIDNSAGDLSYRAETWGTIYLDVSSRHPSAKFTSSYQITVSLVR